MILTASPVRADTLTFDNVTASGAAILPNGYGGLNWSKFGVYDGSGVVGGQSGYINGQVSPNFVAYNLFAEQAITSGAPFTFNSAYFAAAWNDGLTVTVKGYVSGVQVDTKTFTVDTQAPKLETFNWSGVDELTFDSVGGTNHGFGGSISGRDYGFSEFGAHFTMDNFRFNEAVAAPAPATAYAGLVLLGLLGAHKLRRRISATV